VTHVDTEKRDRDREVFAEFFTAVEPRLRRALVAAYGTDAGLEATAVAMAWAWEHRDRLPAIREPVGYLFRVAQSRSRRRKVPHVTERPTWSEPWIEPALTGALARLSERQRIAVVLIHSFSWTHAEVGSLLGIAPTTVQNHATRGLRRLHAALEGDPNA
jgi:DNA-directed RNA polymerase specialized sigma24 family protein